jgi:hypothetical protein
MNGNNSRRVQTDPSFVPYSKLKDNILSNQMNLEQLYCKHVYKAADLFLLY